MANTFIVGTYGHVLTFSTGIDLTGNTALKLNWRKPSNTTGTISSGVTVSGDDSDGVLTYTTTSADTLTSEDGTLRIVPEVTFSAGKHETADPCEFTIKRSNQID
jgi:hypothetical protein